MIPNVLRQDVFPYASIEVIPSPAPPTRFWAILRYHASGYEMEYVEKSAQARALLIIVTAAYADVVAQGERA